MPLFEWGAFMHFCSHTINLNWVQQKQVTTGFNKNKWQKQSHKNSSTVSQEDTAAELGSKHPQITMAESKVPPKSHTNSNTRQNPKISHWPVPDCGWAYQDGSCWWSISLLLCLLLCSQQLAQEQGRRCWSSSSEGKLCALWYLLPPHAAAERILERTLPIHYLSRARALRP